jgi:hypothetical protein
MRQLKVKLAGPEEAAVLGKWLVGTPNNLFDPGILKYPTLRTLCSYDTGDPEPVAFLPTQRALMLESLAVNPAALIVDKGQAFRDLVKGAELLASSDGIRELYFICKDKNVLDVARGRGFELIEFPVVRMRL